MKMVAGLGNPGKQYAGTPHNVEFDAVDKLAELLDVRFRRSIRFRALTANGRYEEDGLLLVKPQTFMNRSGMAVARLARYRKLAAADVIVVLDDADLEVGRMRIRPKGSSGGHRGLESVIEGLGSDAFVRVRLGIGRGNNDRDLIEHVLRPYSKAERKTMEHVVEDAARAVLCMMSEGVEAAMNAYNGRRC